MPSRNTKHARTLGFSGLAAMKRGTKDYGVKTGTKVDSSAERARRGRKAWVGATPPKHDPKKRGFRERKEVTREI